MPDTFRNILIPVDFSANMDTALRRADSLADSKGCEFHLLHVIKPGKKAMEGLHKWEAEKKLRVCKETLEEGNTNVKAKIYVLPGFHIETLIIEVARMISADLVIIGRQPSRRPWRLFNHISPNVIAKKTNCPVLTVNPASANVRTRIIVIPIGNFLPQRRLELGMLLAKKYRAQIHLLATRPEDPVAQDKRCQVFLTAYHTLRESLLHQVQCSSDARHSPGKAILAYAKSVTADMVLVNPAPEGGFAGLFRTRHISDLLSRNSTIQILNVLPYPVPSP